MPDYISEVIDTRGYDGNAREDLRDYFSEMDTICVILDGVTALPGSVQTKILSEWVDEEEYDLINRLSLLINVHGHELARVSGTNGDPEKGKKKKTSELRKSATRKKLNYRIDNTLFIKNVKGVGEKRAEEIMGIVEKWLGVD